MPRSAQGRTATAEEIELVAAIRRGDEQAFRTAVERYYEAMLAVAKAHVLAPETARQVVNDAWTAALGESDGFDGRTPLRRWLLRFVVAVAAPLAVRHDGGGADSGSPAVDPARFRGSGDGFPGHWRAYPRDWRALPADVLRGDGVRRVVEAAIEALPLEQRTVVTVRDIVGCPADEACDILALPDTVARERLHQARSRVRAALERHLDD
jgi:RNA polymerase sigma-70 factor (ECF subfamily)